jgi:hypothetical protein
VAQLARRVFSSIAHHIIVDRLSIVTEVTLQALTSISNLSLEALELACQQIASHFDGDQMIRDIARQALALLAAAAESILDVQALKDDSFANDGLEERAQGRPHPSAILQFFVSAGGMGTK